MANQQAESSELPPAVGYIRLDDGDNDLAVLLKGIGARCVREGLRLVRTFTDRGYDGTQLARTGIVEVQEALRETPGLVVVVPTLDHLSPAAVIRSPLILMVHRLGGKLLVVNESNGKLDGFGLAQHGVCGRRDDVAGGAS